MTRDEATAALLDDAENMIKARDAQLFEAEREIKRGASMIARLRGSLEQIGDVCADNASPTCNKAMALKFVADVVRVTLSSVEPIRAVR